MEGNAFPVPCPLLASELPYASKDAKKCDQAFVRAVKASYAEAVDELLKAPSRASQYHSEQAAGREQMQLVGELREEVIRSQRQVIELQQQLLQQRAAPWPPQALYGAFPYGQWPPVAYAPTQGGALAAPVQDAATLGGNGLSRLLVSLDKVESFAELQARWPVVQRALASTPLDAQAKERAGRTLSLWQRVFSGVRRCFDGWPDADVAAFMDALRAGYRPANRKGAMPIKRFLEGVGYALRDRETGKGAAGTCIGGESSQCGTNAEFEAVLVQAAVNFAAGKGLPVPAFGG